MAGTIEVTIQTDTNHGAHKDNWAPGRHTIVQSNQGLYEAILTVAQASETTITPDGITTLGRMEVYNLDTTNYVDIGPDSAGSMVPFARAKPNGEPASLRLVPGITIKAQANGADCRVAVRIFED